MANITSTASRFSLIAALAVVTALPVAAEQGFTVDLVNGTGDPSAEYSFLMGTVMQGGKPSGDVAVCLARLKENGQGSFESSPELVAYVKTKDDVVEVMSSASRLCQGPECTTMDLLVADHNVEVDAHRYELECSDPFGIAKQFGVGPVVLAELDAVRGAKLEINVRNVMNDGSMTLRRDSMVVTETCTVPSGDEDVRYGLGWRQDGLFPRPLTCTCAPRACGCAPSPDRTWRASSTTP